MKKIIITIISLILTYVFAFVLPSNPYIMVRHINLMDLPLWFDITTLCIFVYLIIIFSIKKESSVS